MAIPFMEGSDQSIRGRWFGQETELSVSEDIVKVEMLQDGAMDDLFKKFAADGLKRDGSVIGGSVRVARLENRNKSR